MFSITMYNSETRVYLEPPLKYVRELQLLDCNVKNPRLFVFRNIEQITDSSDNKLVVINPGTYSINDLKILISITEKGKNIMIFTGDNINYLINNKSFDIKISDGLQKYLGLPQFLKRNIIYEINVNINEPLRLMCSIVDNRMTYITSGGNVSDIKLMPSNLLANIPSQDYPTIPVRKYDNLINYFDLAILDAEWKKFDLRGSSITFSFRFR